MFGWKADEIIGKPVLTLIPLELHPDEDLILGKIRRGERIEHFETVRVRKDGERIFVSLTVSPVKDATGRIVGAAKIVRNITDRKRSEDALRRAEKMAATGQLAASIAHEINNPLQALSNLLALVSYRASLDDETRRLVGLAQSELGRVAHIARQMLSFYRESPAPIPVKLTELLEDVLELFGARARANEIRIERQYESTGEVHGYPVELRQLFTNLIANAMESMGTRGRLRIRVAPAVERGAGRRRGMRVTVADNGAGIPAEVRPRIFDPFFTTKSTKGTGLGLWVVQGIVTTHAGSLRLRSRTGARSGTVVSVFLPAESSWNVLAGTSGAA